MTGVFWRAHPDDRPFAVKDATSREWGSDRAVPPDPGYSAFTDPAALIGYFNPGERTDDAGSRAVRFTGTPTGRFGMDGEPLVVPDMREVTFLPWSRLHELVGPAVVEDIERRNGWR